MKDGSNSMEIWIYFSSMDKKEQLFMVTFGSAKKDNIIDAFPQKSLSVSIPVGAESHEISILPFICGASMHELTSDHSCQFHSSPHLFWPWNGMFRQTFCHYIVPLQKRRSGKNQLKIFIYFFK